MIGGEETLLMLNAYHDGQLSPGEALAMERRLAEDAELRETLARLVALSGEVRQTLAAPSPPPGLRMRIVQRVGFGASATSASWRSYAAVLALGLLAGGLFGGGAATLLKGGAGEAVGDAVLAGHLRALAAPQPFDIASSNRHVVKPWFNGRTVIAPEAPDLAEAGFPLEGGRVDIVDGKTVPTLVYRHDRHVISVTVTPRSGRALPGEAHRAGSTIEPWNEGDVTYWVATDLDDARLKDFIERFRSASQKSGD